MEASSGSSEVCPPPRSKSECSDELFFSYFTTPVGLEKEKFREEGGRSGSGDDGGWFRGLDGGGGGRV